VKILRPLRQRDFALLTAGLVVSLIGDGLYLVAVAWQVYDLSNTPSALALVGLAWSVGLALFLLTGGVVSDRFDRRGVMIGADLLRAVALVAIGILSLVGALEIWHLVILVLFYAAGEAFFGPALSAITPDLVGADGSDAVVEANALTESTRQACRLFVGPAIGGLIVATAGPATAFLIDAGTFVFSALMIALIRTASRGHGTTSASAFDELREGLSYVRSQRWIWVTLIAAGLFTLFYWGPVQVLLPYIVRNDLGGGAGTFGLVLAADGVGSVLAAVLVSQRGLPKRFMLVLASVWSLCSLPLLGYGLATSAWQLMVLGVFHGLLITTGLVIWSALEQTRVPRELRARVMSVVWFVSIGLAPVSFALTGPVAAARGASTTLIVAGIVPTIMTTALMLGFRIARENPPPVDDADDDDEVVVTGPASMIDELEAAPGAAA
jgi:DHA3 family tetracycline resistance protein-like MFS transporter